MAAKAIFSEKPSHTNLKPVHLSSSCFYNWQSIVGNVAASLYRKLPVSNECCLLTTNEMVFYCFNLNNSMLAIQIVSHINAHSRGFFLKSSGGWNDICY